MIDWNIYITKAIKKFIVAGTISGAAAVSEYLQIETVPTEYVAIVMFLSAVIDLALNAYKHAE